MCVSVDKRLHHYLLAFMMVVLFITWTEPCIITYAQVRVSDTPQPAILPENTLPPTSAIILTPTPTFTPTSPPPEVVLQAAVAPADTIVLDFPETGNYLGFLDPGQQYPVTGQYFSWVQFEFPDSPGERGWIYIPTVTLIGDLSEIPQIDPNAPGNPENDQTATVEAQLQTPGAAETATSQARILELPTLELLEDRGNDDVLPTFTPPADPVLRQPTETVANNTSTNDFTEGISARRLPPITPILVLGALGIVGLLISSLRRF